jgi:hypothetical protein
MAPDDTSRASEKALVVNLRKDSYRAYKYTSKRLLCFVCRTSQDEDYGGMATVPDRAETTGRKDEATIRGPETSEEPAEEASEPNLVEIVDIAAKLAEQLMRFYSCDAHAQNE